MIAKFYFFLALLVFAGASGDSNQPHVAAVDQNYKHPPGLDKKKKAFIDFLYPHILRANAEVRKEREQTFALHEKYLAHNYLLPKERDWLEQLARAYQMKSFQLEAKSDWIELKKRVDIIPAPLAIAQAAKESAWGTSRFATEGNNFFGQWCFTFSCGLVPKNRSVGAKHEVKRFASAYESVLAYIRNLNSHPAYHKVRKIRADMRLLGKKPEGHVLALGLDRYSQRGKAYVREVQKLILRNDLEFYRSLPRSV